MHFITLILIVCFLVFLFNLYYLAKDDFIIIRKDISLERIFNYGVLNGIFSLIFARTVYILLTGKIEFFNPLLFFDLPYYPGLSFLGGLLGASLFTYFYSKYKKMPAGKIFDLFSMSIIGVLPLGFFLIFLSSFLNTSLFFNILFVASFILLFIFGKIIFPFSAKGEIEDGSLGLIFMAIFSFLYFIIKLFLDIRNFSLLSGENIIIFILLFPSIIILINREIIDKSLNRK
jgi:hypothetical protein